MRPSHEVLKQAIDQVGVKAVATQLHVSSSLIYKWCQDPEAVSRSYQVRGALNPLDRLRALYELTRNPEPVHWVCEMADGFFVKNVRQVGAVSTGELMESTQRVVKEFAETLAALSGSFRDKEINSQEAAQIRKEWEDLKREGEALVRACESGQFKPSGRPPRSG